MTGPGTGGIEESVDAPPAWTRDQLAVALLMLFGPARRGGPDTAAAAVELGVSRRTVQRWLRAPAGARAPMSSAHAEAVRALAGVDEQVRRDEQRTAGYARDALERIALPKGRGVLPAWREQQWLDQHLVTITELDHGVLQAALTRVTSRSRPRDGQVVAFRVVPTRFHAQLLVHEVLTAVSPWRVRGRVWAPKQGSTRTWLPGAPDVDLDELAATHGLR
ncbi:hypothetical protein GCM10023328_47260 [Modestobacter marinus]|uniref:Uncharacterized protein n=1 Tax=Modestobacter marinus TaxID=477641 RepID=A0A846LV54_9ACTN|nr:hypothetical protein [Modestobacter marinus]NIH70274.1 hypothetical protein [Modestobacter marinus]GGL85526.1 hypothetical protein GCM10011589_47420 [Modestobacter marinus]